MRRRWAKYFEQVLNVADVWEKNINVVRNWRMPIAPGTPGLDGCPVECLKKCGMAVLE